MESEHPDFVALKTKYSSGEERGVVDLPAADTALGALKLLFKVDGGEARSMDPHADDQPPVDDRKNPEDRPDEQKKKFEEWLFNTLYPALREGYDGGDQERKIRVLYWGDVLTPHEVTVAIHEDARLSIGSAHLSLVALAVVVSSMGLGTAIFTLFGGSAASR